MDVLLLSTDLVVVSRLEGAAARAGVSIRSLKPDDAKSASRNEFPVRLVIVDLSTPSIDVPEVVRTLKSNHAAPPTILAFGPHVHEALLAAARDAGCDQVISRGHFFGQLDAILTRVCESEGSHEA